jgi:bifunctional DNase/RNase
MSNALVPSDRRTRTDLSIDEDETLKVEVKKFSIEEMDEILYMATLRAEANAELRLVSKKG